MAEYPNRMGLVVAMPLTGRPVPPQIMLAYQQFRVPVNCNTTYVQVWNWEVGEARESFGEYARQCGAKWLFFLDEDVAAQPHTIRQLIYRLENLPETVAAVGGIYVSKDPDSELAISPLVFRGNEQGAYWDWHVGELFPVTGIGMGCTMIRVAALEKIPRPWFKTRDELSLSKADWGLQGTEDLWFCDQAAAAGFQIYADGALLPDHYDPGTGKVYRLPPDSRPFWRAQVPQDKRSMLDVGSGSCPAVEPGYEVITCDIREECRPDYRCDCRLLPFADGSFDVVRANHVLEHLPRRDADSTLDEWLRVVKPGGELRVSVPDVGWALERVGTDTHGGDALNVLYGAQTNLEDYHRNGFTEQTLRDSLSKVGCADVVVSREHYHLRAVAKKAAA